jgi:MFS family permease
MFFAWSYWALLPAFARDVLREDATGYSLLYAASGVGAFTGALFVAGRTGRRPERAIVVFLLGVSLSTIAFSVSRSLPVAALFRATAGFSMIGFITTATSTMQLAVPDALRGRVIGVWTLVWGTSYPLGQQAMGIAAERVGSAAAIGVGGVICLFATLALLVRGARLAPSAAPAPASESAADAPPV